MFGLVASVVSWVIDLLTTDIPRIGVGLWVPLTVVAVGFGFWVWLASTKKVARLHTPVPKSILSLLVRLATSRCEGKQELRTGEPIPCRVVQLAILGALTRLGYRVEMAADRLPRNKWVTGAVIAFVVVYLAAVAGLIAFTLAYGGAGTRVELMTVTGQFLSVVVVVIGLVVGAAMGLAHLARFCPLHVPGLEEAVQEHLGRQ